MKKEASESQSGPITARAEPDPHGQCALLLVESLLYNLMEKNLLSQDEVLGVIESASAVKGEIVDAGTERAKTAAASLLLLDRIAASVQAYQ